MDAKTIALVDDHTLIRTGLKGLINQLDGFTVIAEGENGSDAVKLAVEYSPDIILLDISMENCSGIEAASILNRHTCPTRILMLSMHDDHDMVIDALRAGAHGYLLKGCEAAELELALNVVANGKLYVSPHAGQAIIRCAISGHPVNRSAPDIPLTERQQEILRLIAGGKGTKQIAWELGLSSKTVDSHRSQIMQRLQIRDIAGLVRYALRQGLADF